ncbi:MAG: hypothetical protein CVU50_01975 [Candidatus Cloacimonetes bacterium HGW-Cloacimonetes-3]|jgi:hypothetical protein|nr:MAG: hypothetical protein CVU50_01975 [Candidatus Cloacimonetes bacterium HGW-Cloacimonetes-3]
MKVRFKYGIRTYSGTLDEMTFGSYLKGKLCIGREYVIPKLTANNTLMGAVCKNLAEVYGDCSTGYKADLKTYAGLNAVNIPKGKLPPTSFAIFMKMMYLFSELDEGHIDLSTVTLTDLQTLGGDIASVADAVENGYLKSVDGADELTANM